MNKILLVVLALVLSMVVVAEGETNTLVSALRQRMTGLACENMDQECGLGGDCLCLSMSICKSYDGSLFGKGKCVQNLEGYKCHTSSGQQFADCGEGMKCDAETGTCIAQATEPAEPAAEA